MYVQDNRWKEYEVNKLILKSHQNDDLKIQISWNVFWLRRPDCSGSKY